jgi:hypothetical protein
LIQLNEYRGERMWTPNKFAKSMDSIASPTLGLPDKDSLPLDVTAGGNVLQH